MKPIFRIILNRTEEVLQINHITYVQTKNKRNLISLNMKVEVLEIFMMSSIIRKGSKNVHAKNSWLWNYKPLFEQNGLKIFSISFS